MAARAAERSAATRHAAPRRRPRPRACGNAGSRSAPTRSAESPSPPRRARRSPAPAPGAARTRAARARTRPARRGRGGDRRPADSAAGMGSVSTHWRTGRPPSTPSTKCAASSPMRRPQARRADAPLAGKGDEDLSRTAVAPEAREAARHRATGEELAQLALDEARHPVAAAALARLGQEGLEVVAHDTVQHGLLGLTAHVRLPPAAELSRVRARTASRPPPRGETLRDRIHRRWARRPSGVSTNDGLTDGQQCGATANRGGTAEPVQVVNGGRGPCCAPFPRARAGDQLLTDC